MTEQVALAPLTTFGIGGRARELLEVATEEDIRSAASRASSFAILGGGSNVLVPDEDLDGLVIKVAILGVEFQEESAAQVRVIAGAGVAWDALVDECAAENLWGIENLAGIPGTVGGAAVQNIGAYGVELESVFEYAEVFNLATGETKRITKAEAGFAYRDSVFKKEHDLLIMRVALILGREAAPHLEYQDLKVAVEQGALVGSPGEIASVVRAIRSRKFPDIRYEGTAGSFFKNPIIASGEALVLKAQFPEMPQYPQPDGKMKVSLAWILDHVLGLKGHRVGGARLYEQQPLVIVVARGTPTSDVEALATEVGNKVFEVTGIKVEREVENLTMRKLSTHTK